MEEEKEPSLKMSFEPNVIEHLGVKMYSHTVPALAELIANAYDACATKVEVKLYNNPHKIVITDDGVGMTFAEINDFYLRIGRNRRSENQSSCEKRIATGKKGLGKLALFGLGNTFLIETIKDGEKISFTLDYQEIMSCQGHYEPKFLIEQADINEHGTTITLSNLKKIQDYPVEQYAASIAKLFNFPDTDFSISIQLDDNEPIVITNKSKYEAFIYEFKWDVHELTNLFNSDFEQVNEISGEIFTTEKPLKNDMKGDPC
jgi:HSP90 family molecular chaperone